MFPLHNPGNAIEQSRGGEIPPYKAISKAGSAGIPANHGSTWGKTSSSTGLLLNSLPSLLATSGIELVPHPCAGHRYRFLAVIEKIIIVTREM